MKSDVQNGMYSLSLNLLCLQKSKDKHIILATILPFYFKILIIDINGANIVIALM